MRSSKVAIKTKWKYEAELCESLKQCTQAQNTAYTPEAQTVEYRRPTYARATLGRTITFCVHSHEVSSSSSSRNEYYLGGIIALLLQDHRTMSRKSVCSNQYMVTNQHWATGVQIKHSTSSDRIREWRPEQKNKVGYNTVWSVFAHIQWC